MLFQSDVQEPTHDHDSVQHDSDPNSDHGVHDHHQEVSSWMKTEMK